MKPDDGRHGLGSGFGEPTSYRPIGRSPEVPNQYRSNRAEPKQQLEENETLFTAQSCEMF